MSSIKRQKELLNDNGILFHALWKGDKEEKFGDLLFVYYSKESLQKIIEPDYEIIAFGIYKEMEEEDSLYIILREKQG